ncbi:putative Ulp1 protease family protein [Giardia muris]|uniref:Putative Ulp1 protease family protein n=1 Tax=Giardia muris TaxID=5742 RepID=A0A4Z1T2Y3_GIAMU|nr:putative Ulp1 protease family protein [Giardia muris]|eukprot:TNJ26781.1 putative Ulp1 protease family protein [Giardia muris]
MAWEDRTINASSEHRLDHHISLDNISQALMKSRFDVEHAHAALMLFLQRIYFTIDKELLQRLGPWETEWLRELDSSRLTGAQIHKRDLDALIGRTMWVTDESINVYGTALTRAAPTVYCFSTHFYSLACTKGEVYVRSWLRHLKKDHQTIIIPINIANTHWVSCCLYLPALLFCGFDSMSVFATEMVQKILSILRKNKDHIPFSISTLLDSGHLLVRGELRPLKDLPITTDDSDPSHDERDDVGNECEREGEKEEKEKEDEGEAISISDSTTSEPSTIQLEEMEVPMHVLFPPPEYVEPIDSELVHQLWELSSYQDMPERLDDDLRHILESIDKTVFGTLFMKSSEIFKPSPLKLRTLIVALGLIEEKAGRFRDLCRYIHLMRRCPVQRNGYDCGVYTLYFMRLCAGHALGFGLIDSLSGTVRSLCAWEIIERKLGLPKNSLF